jgi:hypothetical protein
MTDKSQTQTVQTLVAKILEGCELEDYDYYIYNNQFFVPVEVCLDDEVSIAEGLLHICTKGVDPRKDRFERPYTVHTVANLFYSVKLSKIAN